MTNKATTADDAQPLNDLSEERDQIFQSLKGTSMNILVYHGGDPYVALANRETPTEYPQEGETLVLVEWGEEDYALSVAEGKEGGVSWDLTEELVEIVDTRDEAIEVAQRLFEKYGN